MEEEIIEINLSGFCRTCNSMQTVTCEYIPTESGRKLDVMNTKPAVIMQPALFTGKPMKTSRYEFSHICSLFPSFLYSAFSKIL